MTIVALLLNREDTFWWQERNRREGGSVVTGLRSTMVILLAKIARFGQLRTVTK